MTLHPTPENNNRIGFHYFPDTLHYREKDLNTWLPELKAMGAQWLVLVAPNDRAIPEGFIRGLINAGIEPILHFYPPLDPNLDTKSLMLLFNVYANWGVHYITLFKRANCHDEWSGEKWVQQDLVERFLNIYLPLAESICTEGMIPVFPPLEPGGDFWDTAFLRAAIQSIHERGHHRLLDKMVLGAYALSNNLSLNWGAGGPERWAGARPYFTPPDEEDQLGFRIFDWYTTLCEAVLGKKLPILLLATGSCIGDNHDPNLPPIDAEEHAVRNMFIARLLAGEENVSTNGYFFDPVPDHILAGNFWLLATDEKSEHLPAAWCPNLESPLPATNKLKAWVNSRKSSMEKENISQEGKSKLINYQAHKPIKQYLLLPVHEWGISGWHLEKIQPFIEKHMPTIGFSIDEACAAENVTLVGEDDWFPPETIERLTAAGCSVNWMAVTGTNIASKIENE